MNDWLLFFILLKTVACESYFKEPCESNDDCLSGCCHYLNLNCNFNQCIDQGYLFLYSSLITLGVLLLLTGTVNTLGAGWSKIKPVGPYCTSNVVLVGHNHVNFVVVAVIVAVSTKRNVGSI